MEVQVRRKRGRAKRRWLDRMRDDVSKKMNAGGGSVRTSYIEAYLVMHRPHTPAGQR